MRKKSIIFILTFSLILLSLPINVLALPSGVLKEGSRGNGVVEVQNTLKSVGYSIKADGIYGKNTKAAILNFQKKYKELGNDGIYGNNTRKVLEKVSSGKGLTGSSASSGNTLPKGGLKEGSRGSGVTELQKTLKSIGYNVTADGMYGKNTKAAVLDFQKKYKELGNDGIYGNNTRRVLEQVSNGKGSSGSSGNSGNSNTSGKVAYLTFDDGPSSTVTPSILNILSQNNIPATFFILGSMAEQNPKILKRIHNEGHSIGNHSYSHKYDYIYKNMDNFLGEVNKTEGIMKDILGKDYSTDLFRFPGGSFENYKQKYKTAVQNKGYRVYDWNALNGDSEGQKISQDKLITRLKETTRGQKELIVLMHDTYGKETTAKALPSIIKYLRDNGYTFKRL